MFVFIHFEQPQSTFHAFCGGSEEAARRSSWTKTLWETLDWTKAGLPVQRLRSSRIEQQLHRYKSRKDQRVKRSDLPRAGVRHEDESGGTREDESPWQTLCLPVGSGLGTGRWNVVVLLVMNHRQHSHMPLMHMKVLTHERP